LKFVFAVTKFLATLSGLFYLVCGIPLKSMMMCVSDISMTFEIIQLFLLPQLLHSIRLTGNVKSKNKLFQNFWKCWLINKTDNFISPFSQKLLHVADAVA
jgi:hypothetical protein